MKGPQRLADHDKDHRTVGLPCTPSVHKQQRDRQLNVHLLYMHVLFTGFNGNLLIKKCTLDEIHQTFQQLRGC